MSEVILESQPKPRTKSTTTNSTKTVEPGSSNGSLDFSKLVADHRTYFLSGATRPVEWRESQLIALRSMLKDHAEINRRDVITNLLVWLSGILERCSWCISKSMS